MSKFEPKQKETMTVSVNIRIPKAFDEMLHAISEKKDIKKAELIRQMIEHCLGEYLKEQK